MRAKLDEWTWADARVLEKSPGADEASALRRCGQLFSSYHSRCWYFEIVELVRKLLLTGVLIFIDPGRPGQVAAGMLIAFLSVLLHITLSPMCSDDVDISAQSALVEVFLLLFSGLLLKVDTMQPGDHGLGVVLAASTGVVLAIPVIPSALKQFKKLLKKLRERGESKAEEKQEEAIVVTTAGGEEEVTNDVSDEIQSDNDASTDKSATKSADNTKHGSKAGDEEMKARV